MDILRLPSSEYAPRAGLRYVDVHGLFPLYEDLAFRSNLVLVGAKGLGKSLSFAAFAGQKNWPVVTFDCSEDVRRSHLLGSFVLRGDRSPFVLGPLTTAFEVANEVGKCVLILEELNSLAPAVQKILNGATDWRRAIEVPEAEKVFRLKEGADLWIVGTMNSAGYAGIFSLNEDLKSRLRFLTLDYPESAQERAVLETALGPRWKEVEPGVVDKLLALATETRQANWDYSLSTRDLVHVIEDYLSVGLETALRMALSKFDKDDEVALRRRVVSLFGGRLKVKKAG